MVRFFLVSILVPFVVLGDDRINEQLCPNDLDISSMTLEEKIGQLLIAPVSPFQPESHWKDWERLIQECHVGNVIMKASDAKLQVDFLNRLQKISRFPILVTADAEWGLGMRMVDAISFPKNLTLGAVQNLDLLEEMGRWIGRQAKQVGIHLNFAPVVDVNVNPQNPIIHMRSFGQDPLEVAGRSCALIRGMHQEHLLTCAKHFPGHGDTAVDSHRSLPVIEKSVENLQAVEWIPFQAAIDEGVDCVMSAHLLVSTLDSMPASLSFPCLQILRNQLGFDRLIVSDALNMGALTNAQSVEEIAVDAFRAGNDLLLYGAHLYQDVDALMENVIPRAFEALRGAFLEHRLSMEELDQRVYKILTLKKELSPLPAEPPGTLMDPQAIQVKRMLYREAVTAVGGMPTMALPFVYLAVGAQPQDWIVQKMIEKGVEVRCLGMKETQIPHFDCPVIVGLHQVRGVTERFGLSAEIISLLQTCDYLVLFCTPYALQLVPCRNAIIAYENDPFAQEAVFDLIEGRLQAHGRLPIELFP